LPCLPGSPTLGFGYPLDGRPSFTSLGSLFQLPTLLGFTLQSFSPLKMVEEEFPLPLSTRALPYKTFQAFYRRFSGLIPSKKPSPFLLPEGLVQVGGVCSLGLSHLVGSPSADPRKEASPFSPSPHALTLKSPLDELSPKPQGLSVSGLALSQRIGRRPIGLSSPTAVSNLLKR